MDVEAALVALRHWASRVDDYDEWHSEAVALFDGLDQHLSHGGYLPADWKRGRRRRRTTRTTTKDSD